MTNRAPCERLIYVQFGLCVFEEEISWKWNCGKWICLYISQFLKAKLSSALVMLRMKVLFIGSFEENCLNYISHINISSQTTYWCLKQVPTLTQFNPIFHFRTFWKYQKTFGFLTFLGCKEIEHWDKMC